MAYKFMIYAIDGMDKTAIEADSIEVRDETGQRLEMVPRRSDGKIVLYAENKLVVRPLAGNCAEVSDEPDKKKSAER